MRVNYGDVTTMADTNLHVRNRERCAGWQSKQPFPTTAQHNIGPCAALSVAWNSRDCIAEETEMRERERKIESASHGPDLSVFGAKYVKQPPNPVARSRRRENSPRAPHPRTPLPSIPPTSFLVSCAAPLRRSQGLYYVCMWKLV